jgi:aryl-alcohol dehydrogenase-like predicted oxidoreductase
VSELSLGTWGLSGEAYGPVAPQEAEAVIDRALQLGVTLFDTADCYGNGAMERMLGERTRKHGGHTFVATRIGTDRTGPAPRKNFEPAFLREAFERSRERLGRDKLDIVLLHNPSVVTLERGEATGVLKQLAEQGAVGAWGVSAGSQQAALAAVEAGARVVSLAYNVFRSRDLHAIAGEVAMRGVSVLAHSVLSYGLLTSHWSPERTFDEGDHRRERWSPLELRRRVAQLHLVRALVGGEVLTPRAAALRFVLSNNLVTSAILGPRSTAQLEQLLREAGSGPPYLPEASLSTLPSRLLAAGINT